MQKSKRTVLATIIAIIAFIAICFTSVAFTKSTAYASTPTNEAKIVGGIEYATLQEAVNASVADDEILVLKDINLGSQTILIPSSKKFTLNLDGKTISGETSASVSHAMVQNEGEVILTGDGKITYKYTGVADTSFGTGHYTINNYGILTVNGCTIENTTALDNHMHSAIDNKSSSTDTVLTINSGTIVDETYYAIRQYIEGTTNENKVIINGGTVRGGERAVWMQLVSANQTIESKASLVISGGTLETLDDYYNLAVYVYSYGSSAKNVEVKVSGGTINGSIAFDPVSSTKLTSGNLEVTGGEFNSIYEGVYGYGTIPFGFISGGTFSTPISEEYCVSGFVVAPTTNEKGEIVYGASTVVVGKENAKEAIDALVESYNDYYRYTDSAKTTIAGLVSTAKTAIDGATTSTAINDIYYNFSVALDEVEPISLAQYKQTVTNNITNDKTVLLYTNRYTDENKAIIEQRFTIAKNSIDTATDYNGVDSAVSSFASAVSTISYIPMSQVKAEALLLVDAQRAEAYEVNRYTIENATLIEVYYSTAITTIEGATVAFEVDGALTSFANDLASVAPMTIDEYKASVLANLEAKKKALIDSGDYSKEDIALIEEYFESARLSLEQATLYGEAETAFSGFSAQVNTIVPEDGKTIVLIGIIASVVIIFGALAIIAVIIARRRRRRIVYLGTDEETPVEETVTEATSESVTEPSVDETPVETETVETTDANATETETEESVIKTAIEETTPVEEIAVATVPTIESKPKTFAEKLDEADGQTKSFYEAIREELLSYKKVKSRISQRADSFRAGRKLLAKIVFAGKSIKCYMALEPKNWEYKYFHHRDESVKKSYAQTPLAMRVRSKLAVKKTIQLIGYMAKEEGIEKK